ncbi:baseplate J/gp47 family protein [Agathobaculum sp.]|uniref:baseplate J/gp47 family protein n=1 Tax=Agathobaculum sp. TaxID=2048138 RepID=UPI003AB542AA
MIGRYSDEMTFDYIMNRMLESVPDTVDKREGSIIYDALSPAAAELVKCYMELDVVMDETFVDTASLQYLMLRCKERGVAIQGETAAVIEGVFTPSSVELTAGLRFNCDEVNYTITEKISAGHYKLEAETLGTVGNKYTGLLLPIQTVNGLETAQIAAVLIPAEDGDTTDTLREKYYASIDGEAFGGNVADYREKVNAITGVGGVKVYPVWNGGGTVKLTVIASDYTAPSSELISKVQTAIDPEQNHGEGMGLAPIGHTVTVTGAKYADLTITANVTFAAGWNWENGKSQLVSAANAYLDELCKAWADSETTVVRISQIETHLLTADCVVDVDGTTVNGDTKNIELAADEIPRLSTIGGAS